MHIMKAISKFALKALWQDVWSIWMPEELIVWPNKTLKFLSMLIIGHYPAGFLMLVYLPELDSPLVALMPFWSLPYLLKKRIQIANHSSIAPDVIPKTTWWRCT